MRGAPVVPMLELFRRAPGDLARPRLPGGPGRGARAGRHACSLDEAFDATDGVLIITDHPSYAKIDVGSILPRMRRPALVYDCWRVLPADQVRRVDGIRYASIGLA